MGEAWYVRMGDAAVGPHAREDVERMRRSGELEATTLVWREGTPAWVAYADSGLHAAPPPFPESTPGAAPSVVVPPPLPPGTPVPAPMPGDAFAQAFAMRGVVAQPAAVAAVEPRAPMSARRWRPRRAPLALAHPPVPGMPLLAVADDGWQDTAPAPWRRYFGRMLDMIVVGAPMWLAVGFLLGHLSPQLHNLLFAAGGVASNVVVSTVLTCVLMVPALALVIGLSGTSPGKWVFGTRITRRDGRPIGVASALAREGHLLVSGLALGIPLVSLFTLVASRARLVGDDVAAWDEGRPWLVTHREDGPLQVTLFVFGVVAWLAANVALRMLVGSWK
jgi:uncharacterized RDD family membrane protein YckC